MLIIVFRPNFDPMLNISNRGSQMPPSPIRKLVPYAEAAKKKGDPDWKDACLDVDFVVIIKPDDDATYKNTVDILDEMTINGVKRYAMVKILKEEIELIKATEASNGIK